MAIAPIPCLFSFSLRTTTSVLLMPCILSRSVETQLVSTVAGILPDSSPTQLTLSKLPLPFHPALLDHPCSNVKRTPVLLQSTGSWEQRFKSRCREPGADSSEGTWDATIAVPLRALPSNPTNKTELHRLSSMCSVSGLLSTDELSDFVLRTPSSQV